MPAEYPRPPADVTIAPAAPRHVEGLARVHTDSWRDTYGHLLPERFYDEAEFGRRREAWHRRLTAPLDNGATTHVALAGDLVIGFASSGPAQDADAPRDRELWALYVATDRHGAGVAQALLEASLEGRPASLWVAEDNPRARAFYRKSGFAEDGSRKDDERFDGLAEVRMVR